MRAESARDWFEITPNRVTRVMHVGACASRADAAAAVHHPTRKVDRPSVRPPFDEVIQASAVDTDCSGWCVFGDLQIM